MLDDFAPGIRTAWMHNSFMGMHIGARMSVVKLRDGGVLLHSPIQLTDALRAEIDAIGPVRHIVAPSLYHHVFVAPWQAAYPDAELHAPHELRRKRPDLKVHHDLGDKPHPDWDLVPVKIAGSMLHETVFVHPETRSVISSDLTENFTTSDHFPTRCYLKLAGIHGKIGWSRPLRLLYTDRRAARASIDRLLEHDFERIVIAHGDVIRADGKAAVRQTFTFLG